MPNKLLNAHSFFLIEKSSRENFARRKIAHKKKKEIEKKIERKEVVILDGTLGHE